MRQPDLPIQICSISFPDGGRVDAQIHAESPYQDCPVQFSGEVDRLPVALPCASSILLRAVFQSFARELGAEFHEELIGGWDRYAEDEDRKQPPELCQPRHTAADLSGA